MIVAIVIIIAIVGVIAFTVGRTIVLHEQLAATRADHTRLLCAIEEASKIVGGPTQMALREILNEYRRS